MHDLTAQVTSSLLPFSGVTLDALGEDEISLDCVLHGKFTVERNGLAWLASGANLEVVHAVTGERLSAYCFSGGGENPPVVLAARDFSWLKRSGLLVGLEETEGSVLCLYDLGLSRVVKAVVIPGRITAIEPLVSYGGASTSTQHLHQSLRWFFGIAAVVTDLGHVLLVDLCLDDLSCSQSELEASDLQVVTKSPEDIPRLREVGTRQGRHLCLQLNSPSGVGVTALQYIPRTNQLAVGFSDGHLQLWNMKSLKKEYHSQLEGGRVSVYAFTFQEPENDPRNCCYLWAVQSSQDLEGDLVSLHLLQLAFSERKCLTSGKILYEGLEYCEERYSQDLSGTSFPLRAQASNTRLLSCQTIEKFRAHPDRDDSMNEVASPDTSLSIFCWQVKAYGQGSPSTYIGVFDINRWYHAQMPDSLRTGESLQDCPYLAVWSLDSVVQMVSPHSFLDVVVHERSLSRGLPFTCPPPEQYFNPTTYNFDATCLLNTGIVHLTCTGHQKETLSFLKKAAPCSSDIISIGYSQCLMSGLLSSRVSDAQAANLSQEEQLDAILSTAVETSSLGMITGCIKQWTAEEQPGSALNLRYILDWAWNKVVQTKEELDGICAPLFDSSTNFTDSQTLQLLQHTQRLLSNLSAIFHCMLSEAQELTQQGLAGLMNKNMVSSLISKYAQVVLWFCRTGLLPEGSDEDALQIPRPFFTHSVISSYYSIRREELAKHAKSKWCADCLMIDGLVGQCGESLTDLWKRDEGGTGQYPPPTLHALLDLYLLDNIDEATKHAIVIYLLLDVMYSFPNKDGTSVESFPTAFAIPIGLVKLVQGLWLLDHHDHQSSFDLLLHPAASQFHFEWQHERVLQALMCQGQQSVALRYFHVTKPPITSTGQAKLCLSVLLHNRCLVEAWCLLRQHTNGLDFAEMLGFLYESCQELGLIKELLKLPLGLNEQDCLEKFLQGTGGLQNRELLMVHYLQQANYIPALQLNQTLKINLVNERDPKLKERSTTRNAIMDQYGKVLPRVQRKLAVERAKPYQHPSTIRKEVSRPQPLSTITKRSANEKVMSRAGFIDNVLSKIQEVWLGKDATPQSSPAKTPSRGGAQSSTPRPSALSALDPFLGTPITMTSKRRSRLMDLVVHPSCQSPRPLLSPPRPPSSLVSPKSTRRAPELTLLQTPQVVKRARALAASGSVFSAFTPQSILRSSLRPTPVATPSASPGRSVTPPLRSKESRITFIEEAEARETEKGIRWTNGMAADSEISQLSRGPKATRKTWSLRPAKEEEEEEVHPRVKFLPPDGGVPSPPLRCSEREPSFTQEETAEANPPAGSQTHLSVNFDSSQISVQSTDTTLEYYDAPLSEDPNMAQGHDVAEEEDDDDDVVTLNIKPVTEKEPEGPKRSDMTPEESFNLASADTEKEEEFLEEAGLCEEVAEGASDPKVHEEEGAASDREGSLDAVSTSKREDVASPEQEEPSAHHEAGNQVTESSGPEVRPEEQLVKSEELNAQWEAAELNVEKPKPAEESIRNEAARDQDLTTDLTEFVDQQLFGEALSPPLSRSAIHSASQSQTSLNSECLEEEEPPAVAPSAFTTQKSTISLTSSEPTGTDSHSVVSVNDSEELSSPDSEDDGEEEEESSSNEGEEDEEEEAEDSGSEVEIIDEVQGNGRLPPLQPSSVFMQQEQEHPHFLQELSEQQAAAFSLITPDAEMKIVGEDMEGEVVMVRLGDDDGGLEQGSSYMELKPPTTLLVPFEFMEGQQSPTDGSDLAHPGLQPSVMTDEQQPEVLTNFTLMLEGDKDGAEEAPAVGNDLLLSELPAQPHMESEDLLDKPDVFPLDTDHMEEASEEEQKESLDHNDVRGLVEEAELQTEFTAAKLEAEDSAGETHLKSEEIRRFSEDQDSASASVPGELPAVVNDSDSKTEAVEVEVTAEDKAAPDEEAQLPDEEAQLPEGNGPVDTEMEKTEPAEENLRRDRITSSDTDVRPEEETEEKPRSEEETEEKPRSEEETEEKPRRRLRHQTVKKEPVEQVVGSDSQSEKQTPLTKKAPSTPTRRLTRGRRVAFSSSLPEAADEPQQDGNAEFEKTNISVSASPTRLPRKGQPLQTVTPRRSSRISQSEPPKEEAEDFASASKTPSSGVRRSQSATATRTGSKEKPAATEVEITEDRQEDEVVETRSRRASSKTPSKLRTTQAATPRRSSRRTTSGGEVEPTPLEAGKEEDKEDPVVPPVKRSARKVRPEVLPILFEEEEEKKRQLSSPGRTTRQSSRITLNVYPQTNRKTGGTAPEEVKEGKDLLQSDSNKSAGRSNSRRPSRRGLWDHPEEDLPLLDSPLEVDSETPVADALIKRLQDEEEKQEIKTERTRKRSTKASEEQISSQPPVKDGAVPEPAEDESSPGESSFIYSPSRRRQTRAHNAESPAPSEDLEAPVTRSRRRGRNASLQDKVSSEEDHAEVEKTSKSRKASQKTAKSRAVPESVPIAKVNPISPLPSPTNLLPLALKRITDGEVPAATRNPRRKRLMDTVFSKPVTRRRKL